jgi:uridine kinase
VSEPSLIGIAGPSCAGKSELAQSLATRLDAEVLPLDTYYRDLAHLPPELRGERNFDHPDAVDRDLLLRQIEVLAGGAAIERPVYDFSTHTRGSACRYVTPGRFVVIEGLFTLHWPELRGRLALAVYVDAEDELCLARRLERDVRARGREPVDVREQFERTVRPMCERYVRPSREHADLVVRGDDPVDRAVEAILARLGNPG